ncbi:hypothetical protein ACF1BQ_009255 [Bradyrhizobium sp. RDT10]
MKATARTKSPAKRAFYYLPDCPSCQILYLPGVEPGAVGVNVEPLGEGLRSVFPDGFAALFRPAVALPALLVTPVSAGLPVALPVVVPPVEDPVVAPLVAAPPVAELPPVEPPLDCANANVFVKTSAVANVKVAGFIIAPFPVA